MSLMLSRYIHEAMLRCRFKVLTDRSHFGQIPGIAGVWANERTLDKCREVLREVLEEWLILKIRDHETIPRMGRVGLPVKAASLLDQISRRELIDGSGAWGSRGRFPADATSSCRRGR